MINMAIRLKELRHEVLFGVPVREGIKERTIERLQDFAKTSMWILESSQENKYIKF